MIRREMDEVLKSKFGIANVIENLEATYPKKTLIGIDLSFMKSEVELLPRWENESMEKILPIAIGKHELSEYLEVTNCFKEKEGLSVDIQKFDEDNFRCMIII